VELVHNDEFDVDMAHFKSLSSKASGSLGASQPAAGVLRMALDRLGGAHSFNVLDELSMDAMVKFVSKLFANTEHQYGVS
jgi:L-serine/L-threonine ammonia-lyase